MREFVKSLRRLYVAGSLSIETLNAKRKAWKITNEEYDYITAPILEEA